MKLVDCVVLPPIKTFCNGQLRMWLLTLLSLLSLRTFGYLQLSQYDALQGIYDSLDGPQWYVYGNDVAWDFSVTQAGSDPCVDNWLGQF